MWKLKRRDVGNEYAINKQEFLIGRRPTADICITNLHVSRIHALLTLDNEDLYIEDQNVRFLMTYHGLNLTQIYIILDKN